jgi:hypothetical protein
MKQTIEIDVPDGWELSKSEQWSKPGVDISGIFISFTKTSKDWDWYVKEYFKTANRWICLSDKTEFMVNIFCNKIYIYDLVPFEIRIGLLKFICDDLKINILRILSIMSQINEGQMNSAFESLLLAKLKNICPKEFLDSLFK